MLDIARGVNHTAASMTANRTSLTDKMYKRAGRLFQNEALAQDPAPPPGCEAGGLSDHEHHLPDACLQLAASTSSTAAECGQHAQLVRGCGSSPCPSQRRATPGRGDARQLLINLKVLSRSEPVIMTECAGLNLGLSFTDHLIGLGDPQRVEVLPPPPQAGHGEREREREGREEEGEGEEEKSGSGYWQETSLRVLAVHSGWQIRVIGCQYASASDTDSESHSGRITENESCSGSLCLPESECDQ